MQSTTIRLMVMRTLVILCALVVAQVQPPPATQPRGRALTGITLINGTGAAAVPNAVLIVRNQRIVAAGPAATTHVPQDVERVDLSGKVVMPGIVNAHGHVGATVGLESRPEGYTRGNLLRQLGVYARYGVTTVVSLGDDRDAGFQLRAENESAQLNRSRLYVAGPVITTKTPEEARAAVDAAANLKPDWIKIRVDDNLGTTEKMRPEVYRAVIARAHEHRLRVAAHIFYLADAKDLLRAGVDYLAHSIRDAPVDAELIDLMKARNTCLCPTLMREVSTFVYESRPSFFDDPFFKREADPKLIAALERPARMAGIAKSSSAQQYKKALDIARGNVKALQDAGIRLAAGTDTGPPARFQGYFEHLELEEMVKSGLTPAQTITSATGAAAQCLGLGENVGTLQSGRYADFLVLAKNPLDDIRHTRTLESVWIGGSPLSTR
jgi:imidazolonepropionase-like amidohydrolase